MKNKLINVFSDGNIVIPLFIYKNLKKLNLELFDFIFLMYLNNLGDKSLFNPNKYSNDLNVDLKEVMNSIGNLTDKGFIKVEVIKNDKGLMEEVVLLEDFYTKISLIMMEEVNEEKKETTNDSEIYSLIEKEFGRTLGSIEFEIIRAWLESNISEELIKEALKEAVFNGVFNLKYMDTILYEWGKSGVKSVKDVEERRKKRKSPKEKNDDIDMDIVDWNWFDDENE